MTENFPRQQARTRNFTLGLPRSFQISPDGERVAFLRSRGGGDPVNCLWVLDTGTGAERLVADPATLGGGTDLTQREKARRERVREQATGIVTFAGDSPGSGGTSLPWTAEVRMALRRSAGESAKDLWNKNCKFSGWGASINRASEASASGRSLVSRSYSWASSRLHHAISSSTFATIRFCSDKGGSGTITSSICLEER